MQTKFYPISIIFILLLICSSCSITKQTACPTFSNKTEKVHKPFFSKKPSSKKDKKQLAKTTKKADKQEKLAIKEDLFSKILANDFSPIAENKIALNLVEKKPSFIESKVQKIIVKQIEKKAKKLLDKDKGSKKSLLNNNFRKDKIDIDSPTLQAEGLSEKPKAHPLAIVALVSSLIAIFSPVLAPFIGAGFLLVALILGLLAIIAGGISLSKINKNPQKFKGRIMSIMGLVFGIISIVLLALLVVLIILALENSTWG